MAEAVRQIAVPFAARALSSHPRIDYEDAFLADVGPPGRRTGEQWARSVLESASGTMRARLRAGWTALGLERGAADDPELVLGWEIRRSEPDFALLAADSPLGLRGEVLFLRRPERLLFATFVRFANPLVRGLWTGVAPGHRQAVRQLLAEAARQPR